ncbi:B12-binding domain-containing radical SAM protein [Actinokineospora sp. 24-640]
MRVALIYPPLLDPSAGYHSLSYLKTYAAARRDDEIAVIDANIDAVCHLTEPATVQRIVTERAARRDELLTRVPSLDDACAEELGELVKLAAFDPDELRTAVNVLRDPVAFYDYPSYRWAVERLIGWMSLLGSMGEPGQFFEGFQLRWRGWHPSVSADLTDAALLEKLNRPFQSYYDEVLLPQLRSLRPDVVGLNLTFISQTPFALWLLREIRRTLPTAHLTCGGTELSDIWKYLGDRSRFFDILDAADSAVVGEGETAFVSLLEAVESGTLGDAGSSVLLHPRHSGGRLPLPMYRYEKLRELGTPDLSDLAFDRYLSPEPYVYYSPSRGCYWNKCTFCDYGLNEDSPTSPWRQDPADKVVADLTEISKIARHVYLSVDVLAPATLLKVAEGLRDRGVDVRWGAELRLEKYWSPEKCATLRDGGCSALSVGFESGNQRVLDLIDKGVTLPRVLETLRHMADAGIPIQMMGFTGFPTETFDEAMDSVRFLQEHRELWTMGGLGEFVLTSGAIVAKRPEQFGISEIHPWPGHDIRRELAYTQVVHLTDEQDEQLTRAKQTLQFGDFGRPWLGGTDTPHSYLYHARYGRELTRVTRTTLWRRGKSWAGPWRLNGALVTVPAGHVLETGGRQYDPPSYRHRPGAPASTLFVRADGRVFTLTGHLAAFVRAMSEPATFDNLAGRATDIPGDRLRPTWNSAVYNHILTPAQPVTTSDRELAVAGRP